MLAELKPYPAMKDSGVEGPGEVPEALTGPRFGACGPITPERGRHYNDLCPPGYA